MKHNTSFGLKLLKWGFTILVAGSTGDKASGASVVRDRTEKCSPGQIGDSQVATAG